MPINDAKNCDWLEKISKNQGSTVLHILVQKEKVLTNNQALFDVVWYPVNVSCYTNVAPTLSRFELFSNTFTIPCETGNRVPINWAGKRMLNTFSHSSILSITISFRGVLKESKKNGKQMLWCDRAVKSHGKGVGSNESSIDTPLWKIYNGITN